MKIKHLILLLIMPIFWATAENTPEKPFFDGNQEQQTSYLYAPGMMSTECNMGRYCPDFITHTGERITFDKGGHVIGQPHSSVVFPEINLKKPKKFTLNPITHYLNKITKIFSPLIKRFSKEVLNFNFFNFKHTENPNSKYSVVHYKFNFSKANIAQKNDIKTLNKAYLNHIKKFKDTNVVLYGDSRGAATIFNFIALHKPKHVKAAILDGIFDTPLHCIKHFLFSDKDEETEECMHDMLSLVMGSYKRKGPFPIDYADQITDDVPLLLVTSLKDGLTPAQGAFNLYAKLIKKGSTKVHLLVLKKSLHPCYMIDDKEDKETYESVVHAFYKHYNLPYNTEKAQLGQPGFEQTKISLQDLKAKHLTERCSLCSW